jgi:lipopolysaccharide transport system permease protein
LVLTGSGDGRKLPPAHLRTVDGRSTRLRAMRPRLSAQTQQTPHMASMPEIHAASPPGVPVEVISAARQRPWRYLNPLRATTGLWQHRDLIWQLAWRELRQRYQGSVLGLGWSLITPLLYLAVYTFVFSVVFKAKWGASGDDSRLGFALNLFCGLILFNIFSETAAAAPMVVLQGANFVKKTVFPLEVLSVISLVQVLIRSAASLLILLVAILLLTDKAHWTMALVVLPIVPLVLLSLGVSWFLAALGVFLRDISHAVTIILQVLFFLTPIVYPLENVPEAYQWFLKINPLTYMVGMMRAAAMQGMVPSWRWLALSMVLSLVVFQVGYLFFMKSKRAFADVI